MPIICPSTRLSEMRKTIIDEMDITMAKRTSLAARSALGNVNAVGQSTMPQPLWIKIKIIASRCVSGDRWNSRMVSGSVPKISAFQAAWIT